MKKFGKYMGKLDRDDRYMANLFRQLMIESNSWYAYDVDHKSVLEFRYPNHTAYFINTDGVWSKYHKDAR